MTRLLPAWAFLRSSSVRARYFCVVERLACPIMSRSAKTFIPRLSIPRAAACRRWYGVIDFPSLAAYRLSLCPQEFSRKGVRLDVHDAPHGTALLEPGQGVTTGERPFLQTPIEELFEVLEAHVVGVGVDVVAQVGMLRSVPRLGRPVRG